MGVRAKFRVNSIEDWGQSKTLKMSPVYESNPGGNAEDISFTKATPNGKFEMTVDNPAASEQFAVGDIWYLDFTKVERPAT